MASSSECAIHYITNHGVQPESKSFDTLSSLTNEILPILSEEGFKFLGWYLSTDYNPSTKLEVGQTLYSDHGITNDGAIITFYAYWVENKSFLIQEFSLTSIADKIRVLSGTTDNMSLDTMKTHIDDANNTISSQSDTIAEITEVLNNIGAGNGTNSGTGSTKKTATINLTGSSMKACWVYFDGNGTPKRIGSTDTQIEALGGALFRVTGGESLVSVTSGVGYIFGCSSISDTLGTSSADNYSGAIAEDGATLNFYSGGSN